MKINIRLPATVAKMLAPHIESMPPITREENASAERGRQKAIDADAKRAAIVARLGKLDESPSATKATEDRRAGNDAKLGKR